MAKRTGRRVSRKRNTSRKYSKKRYSKKRYSKKRYSKKRYSKKRYSKRVSRRKTTRKVMVGGANIDVLPEGDVTARSGKVEYNTENGIVISHQSRGTTTWRGPFKIDRAEREKWAGYWDGWRLNVWPNTEQSLGKWPRSYWIGCDVHGIINGLEDNTMGMIIKLSPEVEMSVRDIHQQRGPALKDSEGKEIKRVPNGTPVLAYKSAGRVFPVADRSHLYIPVMVDGDFGYISLTSLTDGGGGSQGTPAAGSALAKAAQVKAVADPTGQGATRGEGYTSPGYNNEYFSEAPGGSVLYTAAENAAINYALFSGQKSVVLVNKHGRFEVRFGKNGNKDYGGFNKEPASRMWQVNTVNQNTRIVDVMPDQALSAQVSEPYTVPAPQPEPEPSPQTEPEPSPQTEPEPTHEGVAGRAGAKGEGAMVEPGGEGEVPVDDMTYYSIGRGGQKWPYIIPENTAINDARRSNQPSVTLANDQGKFEVCFAENGNTDWGQRGKPPSGMWQVNLNEGDNYRNIREVWEYPKAVTKPSMEDAIPSDTEAPPASPIVPLGNEWDLFRGPLPEGDDIQGQGGIMMTLEEATEKCSENPDAYGFTVQLVSQTPIGGGQYNYNIWIKDNKNKDKKACELMPGWQSFTKKEKKEEKIWL